nr:hypothetical protein HmN_000914500 [Hymenolepis microstoma]
MFNPFLNLHHFSPHRIPLRFNKQMESGRVTTNLSRRKRFHVVVVFTRQQGLQCTVLTKRTTSRSNGNYDPPATHYYSRFSQSSSHIPLSSASIQSLQRSRFVTQSCNRMTQGFVSHPPSACAYRPNPRDSTSIGLSPCLAYHCISTIAIEFDHTHI